MEVCSINKIFNLFILISLVLNNKILIESYSQVSRVGAIVSSSSSSSNNNSSNSEIIKHNPGREGVFSSDNDENINKTISEYNVDDEIITAENKSSEVFTGRSSPSMSGFQFPLNFNTKPISSYRRPSMAKLNYNPNGKISSSPIFVYPSYGSKSIDQSYKYPSNLPPPSTAMDRFSPGEAYGFQQYQKNKNKPNNGYDYTAPKSRLPDKTASPPAPPPSPPSPPVNRSAAPPVLPTVPTSPPAPVYVPPKDLYAFPPNIGANYLPPSMKGNQRPVTSYLPPPAGVSDDFDPNLFVGPVNPKYLPSSTQDMPPGMPPQDKPSEMTAQDMPPSIMMTNSGSMEMDSPPSDDHNHDHDHDHPPPSSDGIDYHDHHYHDHPPPSGPPSGGDGTDYHDYHHHYHDHDHNHDMPPAVISDTPPPPPAPTTENPLTKMMAMVVEALKNNNKNNSPPPPQPAPPSTPTSSDMTFSSPDHDHFHDAHDHDFHYDHNHGHYGIDAYPEIIYDHDPHHHDIVTTTEPPPPPEEHMESRVKKYSYYYLGRKLWYIPLYFTVYFSFYVAALIIRSIGRHKVEWPNHYQKRSTDNNIITHKETVRKVEKLTKFVMNSIEDFKEKYL